MSAGSTGIFGVCRSLRTNQGFQIKFQKVQVNSKLSAASDAAWDSAANVDREIRASFQLRQSTTL